MFGCSRHGVVGLFGLPVGVGVVIVGIMETGVLEPVESTNESSAEAQGQSKRYVNPDMVPGGPSLNPDGRAGKRVPIKELHAAQAEIERLKKKVEEKEYRDQLKAALARVAELEDELSQVRAAWESDRLAWVHANEPEVMPVDEGTLRALELLSRMGVGG